MTVARYFWDLNDTALKEAVKAVRDPRHPQFPQRMATLLSRCDDPKELFAILPKKKFIDAWPRIRAYWLKRERQSNQRSWWEAIYDQLQEAAGQKSAGVKGKPAAFLRKLGETIREHRLAKGLSQAQVAQRAGLKQPVVSQIEEGRKNITMFTLVRLGDVLGIETITL